MPSSHGVFLRVTGVCFIKRARATNGVAEPREDDHDRDAPARARARVPAVRGAGPRAAGEHRAPRAAGGAGAEHHARGGAEARGGVHGAHSGERGGDIEMRTMSTSENTIDRFSVATRITTLDVRETVLAWMFVLLTLKN